MYLVQTRDENGKPVFEEHLAYPTTPGIYYVFKKTENYLSNIYYDTTVIKMGGLIRKENGVWMAENKKGEFVAAQPVIQDDLNQKSEDWEYTYYDVTKNASGEVVEARWGSHPFGRYALQTSRDLVSMHPELIHSSGDLMMEERQLIADLIKVLTAPHDDIDKTIAYSQNFVLYKTCYDFVNNPAREDLVQAKERAYYRLYNGQKLTAEEAKILPSDAIAADKVLKNKELTKQDVEALIGSGVAYYRGGKLRINMEKVLGLQFDTYQYVVMIQKYAHHYGTLKKRWKELSSLRSALLKDFNQFVIKDPKILHSYMRDLMLKRTELKKLSNEDALNILKELLN